MKENQTIDKISTSTIGLITKLKDVRTLSKIVRCHNKDIVSSTLIDKIDNIVADIENELKTNLNLITSYHYMNTLVEKLTETTKRAKEIESVKFSDIDKVPEDFDVEKYDELTGKYMDQNKNE